MHGRETDMDTQQSAPALRWLAIGNSLTRHRITSFWWNDIGMAATTAEHDYVHLVAAYLRARCGSVTVETFNFADWERGAAGVPPDRTAVLPQLDAYLAGQPRLITVQLGENAVDVSTFTEDTEALLRYLQDKVPDAALLLIDDFWSPEKGDMKQTAAERCGVPFVSLARIKGDPACLCGMGTTVYDASGCPHTVEHPGVAAHPGDRGMRCIADGIIAALERLPL